MDGLRQLISLNSARPYVCLRQLTGVVLHRPESRERNKGRKQLRCSRTMQRRAGLCSRKCRPRKARQSKGWVGRRCKKRLEASAVLGSTSASASACLHGELRKPSAPPSSHFRCPPGVEYRTVRYARHVRTVSRLQQLGASIPLQLPLARSVAVAPTTTTPPRILHNLLLHARTTHQQAGRGG